MSLIFPYTLFPTARPIWPLNGRTERPRPVIFVSVLGPKGTVTEFGLLDNGSDDTVFQESLAKKIGLDLNNAPVGSASGAGSTATALLRYAEVLLRITDGKEFREWKARVGFTAAPLRQPLLGFAGFLQFFTATFFGDLEQVELTINTNYQGT